MSVYQSQHICYADIGCPFYFALETGGLRYMGILKYSNLLPKFLPNILGLSFTQRSLIHTKENKVNAICNFQAYWAFTGYSTLSQVVEEVKQPLVKTVPMAISIAMVIVTVLYLLANLAYIIVLSPTEMVASSAVAVTYGAKITFVLFYIMPVFVTLSSFGTVNSNIMSSSR